LVDNGLFGGIRVGGGINYQSRAFSSGYICTLPIPLGGDCRANAYVPFDITIKPYALVSGFIDYPITDRFSLAVNGTNIFNKRTFGTVYGGPGGGNSYVQPAAVTATLRAKW
jgi:outer membrane receptor protein involved in Fe transport